MVTELAVFRLGVAGRPLHASSGWLNEVHSLCPARHVDRDLPT